MEKLAYRPLAAAVRQHVSRGVRKLVVTSSGPGEGKSTIAGIWRASWRSRGVILWRWSTRTRSGRRCTSVRGGEPSRHRRAARRRLSDGPGARRLEAFRTRRLGRAAAGASQVRPAHHQERRRRVLDRLRQGQGRERLRAAGRRNRPARSSAGGRRKDHGGAERRRPKGPEGRSKAPRRRAARARLSRAARSSRALCCSSSRTACSASSRCRGPPTATWSRPRLPRGDGNDRSRSRSRTEPSTSSSPGASATISSIRSCRATSPATSPTPKRPI